jgi:hypothetical protein
MAKARKGFLKDERLMSTMRTMRTKCANTDYRLFATPVPVVEQPSPVLLVHSVYLVPSSSKEKERE